MGASTGSYYKITIQTKPFLKKYLLAKYGNPLVFTTDNFFGICIAGLLQRPVRIHKRKEILRMRTDKFIDKIDIQFPISFLTKDNLGFDISDSNVISLNKLFEEDFEEKLTFFCTVLNICGVETKDAMEEFCKNYDIEVGSGPDSDITFDALKKKEYRYRKHKENISAQVSPENREKIKQTLLF